eukprot:Opistho-2@75795
MPRTIVSLSCKDVQRRQHPNKHYVYVVDVTWSDNATETVFRSYDQFFAIHNKLLDSFPLEAGKTSVSDRVIPYLPGRQIFRRTATRHVAEERFTEMVAYCNELRNSGPSVFESEILTRFFSQTEADIHPPDMRQEEGSSKSSFRIPTISRMKKMPMSVSLDNVAKFQARANADFEATESKQLSFSKGDMIDILAQDDEEWWFAQIGNKQGWVPANLMGAADDKDRVRTLSVGGRKSTIIMRRGYEDESSRDAFRRRAASDDNLAFVANPLARPRASIA